MKFLVIGLGSMGKRRIRNLQYLGEKDIVGFDIENVRRLEAEKTYGISTCPTLKTAFAQNPDAVIISTSPAHHYKLAMTVASKKLPFFMEANVIPQGFDKVIRHCKKKKVFVAPSCTMRFQPSIKQIKSLLESNAIGKVLHFTYHVGQYLPDWHPYEDYRKFYVSKRETGACREIVPFELNWIIWAMGNISFLTGLKRKISNLEADIDDIYSMILQFQDGKIGTVVIDVLARVPYRTLKIVGTDGVITWEWRDKQVSVYSAPDKKWQSISEPPGIKIPGYVAEEDMYIEEMKSFVNGIKTGVYSHSLQEEGLLMKLLSLIESCSDNEVQKRAPRIIAR